MSSGVTRAGSSRSRQQNSVGELQAATLDAVNSGPIVLEMGIIAEKCTFVMNGTLAGSIDFSINGKDFYGSTALAATGIPTLYNAQLFRLVRIQRTSGAGTVTIACK